MSIKRLKEAFLRIGSEYLEIKEGKRQMTDLKIGRMVLGALQTNCYFLYRTGSSEAIVIDPADYGSRIVDKLEQNGFCVAGILLTHGHCDHIWGCEELRRIAQEKAKERGVEPVRVYAMEAERELLQDTRKNLSHMFGKPYTQEADIYLRDGDELTIAGITFKVIATPGHTEGGCCYYFEEAGILVSGDTLFQESTGRTDFPGGSASALVRSIQEKLFVLPEDTLVYSGHGDSTTIGHEKKYNPYCAVKE